MYINDVHILYYIGAAILGLFVGIFSNWCIKRMQEEETVLSKDILKEMRHNFKPNYIIMLIIVAIYISLIYLCGVKETVIANLNLIEKLILAPALIIVFVVDYKKQIIPNRLNLTLFEIGLCFTFLYGLSDIAISINRILGMFAGAGIFILITLIGGVVYGKEAMGLGDVKLMGVLGLFFGLYSIIEITLVSFLIGAVLSIVLLVLKIKKTNEYIPFGPFIVIATFVSMYVPFEIIKDVLMKIFTLGMYH